MAKTVYISDNTIDFQPITWLDGAGEPPEVNTYPYVVTPPDPEIKNPKYDWHTSTWVEASAVEQGVKLVELQAKVKDLTEANTSLNEQVTQLQQALTDMAMTTLTPETEVGTDDTNA